MFLTNPYNVPHISCIHGIFSDGLQDSLSQPLGIRPSPGLQLREDLLGQVHCELIYPFHLRKLTISYKHIMWCIDIIYIAYYTICIYIYIILMGISGACAVWLHIVPLCFSCASFAAAATGSENLSTFYKFIVTTMQFEASQEKQQENASPTPNKLSTKHCTMLVTETNRKLIAPSTLSIESLIPMSWH